jgi:RNA-directed DNA polymerase
MSRLPIRGGNWNNGANAGVFNLNLNNARSNANTNIGFRPALRQRQKLAAYGRRPGTSLKGSAIPGQAPKYLNRLERGSSLRAKLRRAGFSMPITYSDLYARIYDFENLYQAYRLARRGKRYRREAILFRRNLEENLINIQNQLVWQTYRTGRYHFFTLFEPKERQIAALPFFDRVVQHALVRVIEPIWRARFFRDSYACQRGKGTHAGADRAQHFLRVIQRNHGHVCVLKADIAKYFASIDHGILKSLFRKRIYCGKTLDLMDGIVDSAGLIGIPIGNLTSQLFANIYLHELDCFVKQELRERFYLRYMDDFAVMGPDKAHLHRVRRRIEEFLRDRLRLQTNTKTQVFPVGPRALDFLGYRIWPTHRLLRKASVKRMRRALRFFAGQRDGFKRARPVVCSWIGHAMHADTYRLRRAVLGSVGFGPEVRA